MSMPELRSNGDDSPQKPVIQHSTIPTTSPLIPSPQQRKHWAKQYRTEIAASSSSVLSTFAAVSGGFRQFAIRWALDLGSRLAVPPRLGEDSYASVRLFIPWNLYMEGLD
ncbi:MAG: hypothetical protein Q9225_004142 [Loekoesia sp. 1 TL-2023]